MASGALAGILFGAIDALRVGRATSLDAAGVAWLIFVAAGAGAAVGLLVGLLLGRRPHAAAPCVVGLLVAMVGATQLERRAEGGAPATALAMEAVARALVALLAAALLLRLLHRRQLRSAFAGGLTAASALLALASGIAVAREAARVRDLASVTKSHVASPATSAVPGSGALLVVVDTLRADALGSYGQPRPTSPHLDRVSRESVLFAEAWAHASWTKPATASLLTSLPPELHGARAEAAVLAERVTTLSEVLAGQGRATIGFSANGVVASTFGFQQGFCELHLLASTSLRAQALSRLALGRYLGIVLELPAYLPAAFGATADMMTTSVRARRRAGLPRGAFLYVHYMDPHHPYFAGGDRLFAPRVTVSPRTRDAARDAYQGEVELVDREVARLLADVRADPSDPQPVLLVTADHGEELYEHGGRGHGYTLYDEQLRIPLLVRAGGVAPRVAPDAARGIDVAPTLLGLLGIAAPADFQGRDLLAHAPPPAPGAAIAHREDFGGRHLRAARASGLKLIVTDASGAAPGRAELFDLAADPGERTDVAASRPADAARMAELLPAAGDDAAVEALGPEARETLEALGYLAP